MAGALHQSEPFAMKLQQEIVVRVAVAAVALPLVGTLLWRGDRWAAGLFAIAAGIAAYEYYRMTDLRHARIRWLAIAAAFALPALPLVAPARWPAVALGVLATTSLIAWTALLLGGPRREVVRWTGILVGGVAYISTGLVSLAALRAHTDGLAWCSAVLIAAWSNDTGAFFGGKLLGRHRLLPVVSPGKTWEGLAVGAMLGIAAMLGARRWLDALSLADAVVIGSIASVFGPVGDLCKSMVKRAAGTKDSGRLFLAHGGMLDRIDAILFDAPGVLAYALARSVL